MRVSAEQTGICLSQECPGSPVIWECVSRLCRRGSGFFRFRSRGRKAALSRLALNRFIGHKLPRAGWTQTVLGTCLRAAVFVLHRAGTSPRWDGTVPSCSAVGLMLGSDGAGWYQQRSLPVPGLGEPEPQCCADGLGLSQFHEVMQANRVLALSVAD